ncbi:MAG: glycerophosphodiester phosphodiesterase [Clostridiales bacterium]|nr:glycerophosphodiester phosphodiesterase [Clostridiales bacterium]
MNDILIIAHRGANRVAPQNTMPAFIKACEYNADGIETDIHMTKDKKIVLCHNYTVNKTSDGSGKIGDFLLSQLLTLDFGSYFMPEFKNVRIPTIEDLLIFLKRTEIKVINIEIKSSKINNAALARQTIEKAKEYGLFDKLLISSFDENVLIMAKNTDPKCQTALLYPFPGNFLRDRLPFPLELAKKIHCDAVHPHMSYVSKGMVNKAHKMGIKVNAWTVNTLQEASRLIDCGVDGLITDCPFKLKSMLE